MSFIWVLVMVLLTLAGFGVAMWANRDQQDDDDRDPMGWWL